MEKSAMSKYQKYLSTLSLSFVQSLKNKNSMLGLSLFLLASIAILEHIWKGVAAGQEINVQSSAQLLWYITFNNWVIVSLPSTHESMARDIKSGHVAYLLPKPVSYLGFTFSKAMGTFLARLLVLGVIGFTFTWTRSAPLPFSPSCLGISLIFGIFAGGLAILFQMIIGLLAFSFDEVSPFYWVFEKLSFILGGLLLPLAAYPNWLLTLSTLSPFPAILGERSALVLSLSLPHVLSIIFSYIGWGAVAIGTLLSLYRRAVDLLHVEGG
jgi:ABC-2 type transport system permease protein